MKTRSRSESGSEAAEAEGPPASPPSQSPRSTKNRKAATSTPPAAADAPIDSEASESTQSRAKKSKPEVPAAAAATPSSGARTKTFETKSAENLETSEKLPRSKAGKQAAETSAAAKADEDQSSLVLGDGASSTSSEGVTEPAKGVAAVGAVAATAGSVSTAPKGRCVSGRDWKVRNQSQRASMQVTTATETLSTTWAKKLELKAKRKAIMAMEQEMKDQKRQEVEDKKQEKLEREKRRQQNEMKNTTYQTISKTHKMKTMSKKQLRQIKKRQVNSRTGEIEFVSPWGGGKKK